VAARSMAKVSITLGLLTVPVSLFKATESGKDFELHQYDRESGSRIRYVKTRESDGQVVDADSIVKGTEVNGQVVLLDQDDQAALEALVPASAQWDIVAFVPASEINPLALSGDSYHLAPQKAPGRDGGYLPGAEKAYVALAGAIRRSGKLAVTAMAMRGRVRPVVIGADEQGVLVAQAILYPAQLRQAPVVPQALVSEIEAALVDDLVGMMSADHLDVAERDDYDVALSEVITAKLAGKCAPAAVPAQSAPVTDLAALLSASLQNVQANPPTMVQASGRGERRGVLLNA
jgi:DNA end-binding protein Ku